MSITVTSAATAGYDQAYAASRIRLSVSPHVSAARRADAQTSLVEHLTNTGEFKRWVNEYAPSFLASVGGPPREITETLLASLVRYDLSDMRRQLKTRKFRSTPFHFELTHDATTVAMLESHVAARFVARK